MPHLKVKPFDSQRFDAVVAKRDSVLKERAVCKKGPKELLLVGENGKEFILELKKKEKEWLLRCDSVSRPLDVELIKRILASLAKEAGLEILHSNIESTRERVTIASRYDKKIDDFEKGIFPYDRVALEVGFGSGRHLLYQAGKEPDRLHIGIEIHTPSAQQVLRQIALRKLENIWVLNYDARLLLEMLPSNLAEAIFVHFPVPWDKKPHRRVIGSSFVSEALRVLDIDGILELRTDSENYYRYALEIFSEAKRVRFEVKKNEELPVVSKYEARWRREEKNIYNLTLYSMEKSPQREICTDFSFCAKVSSETIGKLPPDSLVFDEYFIHFTRVYDRVYSKGYIVEVSFGNSDKPEHKYLFIEEDGSVNYFPSRPVANKTNMRAHKKIGELLDVHQ